ncbi:MAG TPA: glycosyltransferase [Blastocatellia bacterium]|nr:glycosyltransferase [Blastocatellia bacterium]
MRDDTVDSKEQLARPRAGANMAPGAGSRPRVLHLITKFEIGGTERQAVELLNRLDPARYDVRLAAIRNEGPFYQELAGRYPDVPEYPLTSFYNANAVRQLSRLAGAMRRQEIDILHAHDFYAGIIGAAAARLARVRVIASQRHLKLSDRRSHELGTRLIHRLAHRLLVNSEAIRDYILKHGSAPAGKIVVIRNGLHVDEENPVKLAEVRRELRRELGLEPDAKVAGMVARLQPVKGHRYFIEAASIARVPDAHFVLVGDGPLKSEILQQAAALGIGGRVHLLGDRKDARRLVSAFDVAVLSSLHEGLPNSVMEAQAAGVPVVATAVGGTTELISDKETGYLVPPEDARALADRIEFCLLDREEGARVGARGRAFISDKYGVGRMVESVERLYDETLEGRSRRRMESGALKAENSGAI